MTVHSLHPQPARPNTSRRVVPALAALLAAVALSGTACSSDSSADDDAAPTTTTSSERSSASSAPSTNPSTTSGGSGAKQATCPTTLPADCSISTSSNWTAGTISAMARGTTREVEDCNAPIEIDNGEGIKFTDGNYGVKSDYDLVGC